MAVPITRLHANATESLARPTEYEYLFALEPAALVQHFLAHPPQDFTAQTLPDGTPAFRARFDLLTTADASLRRRAQALPGRRLLRRLLEPMTLFVGSTVSEYLPLGSEAAARQLPALLRSQHIHAQAFTIIKDIPAQSPLLDARQNRIAQQLCEAAQAADFVLLEGQALAHLPLDFASMDAWLARFSAKRRYDIRRKLKQRERLHVETWPLGCAALRDAALRQTLYALYLQVYAQSDVHFDCLTPAFFDAVFTDDRLPGFLFVFRQQDRIIGWKLCFEHAGMLIDKYVGFSYPEAREFGLFFVSWAECLDYALRRGLRHYVAGWTDPEVKAYLGAGFTMTRHAVYARNRLIRAGLRRFAHWFESDGRRIGARDGT